MKYPKWKYRVDPMSGAFQSTLVASAEIENEIGASWTDDPHAHGVEVVPMPAELLEDGSIIHSPEGSRHEDANGNFAYGPKPTATGVLGRVRIAKG